jgi:uncharacterized protein YbjT (DUF2867 family)
MRLAIFGATGATGRHLVDQALRAGHHVTALARRPGALTERPRLDIVVGDLDQPLALQRVLRDADVVISMLGVRKGSAPTVCEDGMRAILSAMPATGVSHLVALSAYGASETSRDSWFVRLVRKAIGAKMRDKDAMETLVRGSGAAWTLVRPPVLTNGAASGDYRSGPALKPGWLGHLSRADLAAFILTEAETGAYTGKAVVVSA